MLHKLFLLLLCLFLVACGSTEYASKKMDFTRFAPAEPDYDPEFDEKPQSIQATINSITTTCPVLINTITDKRHNRDSFGTSYRYKKFAEYVPDWVQASLLSIKHHHFYLTPPATTNLANQIIIDVEILKAYMHHRATSLNANVVLRISYKLANKTQKKIHRGMDTSLNWGGGTHEVEESMNIALSKILDEITIDINKQCRKL